MFSCFQGVLPGGAPFAGAQLRDRYHLLEAVAILAGHLDVQGLVLGGRAAVAHVLMVAGLWKMHVEYNQHTHILKL